ncbi:diacylglycerol/lipid kinase family protein [Arenimonas sp. MALMAid1274]|uniref:diacylglycerol/lipid kinase family protein n=1 Tax=Arenimonas sp. MALMAid1274 TaxID=3411630 RepID=UPI003B9FFB46
MTTTPATAAPDARLHIVINAASGSHDGEQTIATIAGILDEAGRAHQFLRIDDPSRISEVAAEAVRHAKQDQGIVVAVGGDGTLNAVAQAVLGSGCVYAVLPQGTFNYFGRVNGISQDIEVATRALLRGQVEPVQVGRVNGRVFLVNASLGLYPQVLQDREAAKKQMGRSRWVALFSGLRTLLSHRRQLQLDIETAGQRRSVRTPTLFVGNNQLQLERIGIAEEAALEQGRLAGVMVRPTGTWSMLGLALRGALGRLGDADNVESFAFRRLTVQPRGQRRSKVAIDGEILWMTPPLVFDVSPEPLSLLAPRPEDRVAVE